MRRTKRRHLLQMTLAAGLAGLSGCTSLLEEDDDIQDTDGDGVIDSEDYAPRDPEVQREEQVRKVGTEESTPAETTETPDQTPTADETTQTDLVDLNTASRQELTSLPGVGVQRAERIVSYRETRETPISDPYELTEVQGITRELIDQWEGLVTPPLSG